MISMVFMERMNNHAIKLEITNGFELSDPSSINSVTDDDYFVHLSNVNYVPGTSSTRKRVRICTRKCK